MKKRIVNLAKWVFIGAVCLAACAVVLDVWRETSLKNPLESIKLAFKKHAQMPLLEIQTPSLGSIISSPLIVKGKAQPVWFNNGTFEVVLTDEQGEEFARSNVHMIAKELGGLISFESEIEFKKIDGTGFLIFSRKQPNTDGLPVTFQLPVRFD